MTSKRRLTVAAACFGWFFSAVDTVLLILFQKQVADALGVDVQVIRVAIGVGLLGGAVGGVAFAQFGDRVGRVRTLAWCVVLYSFATAGMAIAPTSGVLLVCRFLAGMGTGGEWSVGFALITEVWTRASRGAIGGIVSAMFNLGTFLAIGLFQSGIGWRWSFGVMVLPALGVSWLRRRVPESPVWLEFRRAQESAVELGRANAASHWFPAVSLFRPPLLSLVARTTLVFALMNFAFYAFSTIFIGYLQDDVTRGGLGLDAAAQAPFQLALNFAGMAGLLLAGLLSDRIGRRPAFAAFCAVGALGYAELWQIVGLARGSSMALLATFAVICVSYGIVSVMGSLASELFPTHLRSTGPGVCQNLGKGLGGLLGPTLAGAWLKHASYAPVLAMPGLCLAALAALIWTLPEAGGRVIRAVE